MSPLILQKKFDMSAIKVKRWSAGITSLLVVFGILYLGQINAMATRGYELKALEMKKAELMKIQKELEVKVAETQSTENILKRIEALQLVKVTNISYISASSTSVALAK